MAPREEDKAMDGLLRRTLARGADAAAVCPEPEVLAAYFERSLDGDETGRCELHFSQCSLCREQLGAIARAGAPAGASASGAGSANLRWAWLRDWRWLAVPAAAALAFAVFGFLWMRPGAETTRQAPSAPPGAASVAQEQPQQPAPFRDGYARREKKTAAPSVVPAPLRASPPADEMALKSAPSEARNPPAMPAPGAGRNPTSGATARRQSGDKNGALLTKNEQAKPSAGAAGSNGAIGSMTESVEVTSTARPVAAPAKPQLEARKTGEAAAGANTGAKTATNGVPAADASSTISGAGVEETETRSKARRVEKQSVAPAIEAALARANNDSSHLITIGGQPAATMILTPDPAILWRFAGSGFVERSTDGGATWQGEQPSAGGQVLAGAAPSANVCWLVGRDGLILLTKDARSWKKIAPPEETDFIAVSAENAPNATVTTADGRKFATRNGGKKWKPAERVAAPLPN